MLMTSGQNVRRTNCLQISAATSGALTSPWPCPWPCFPAAQRELGTATKLRPPSRVQFPAEARNISAVSTPISGPTQLPVQSPQGAPFPGTKSAGDAEVRIHGAVPPLSNTSSWHRAKHRHSSYSASPPSHLGGITL
jgi:hypothetical protein